MNAPMNLEDLLREQADTARFAPLPVESVMQRARRIRRRRTAGGMAGVVAAAAMLVGGTAVVLDGGRPDATPPIAHSPSDVASPSAAPASVIHVVPSGHGVSQTFNDALRVPYWADGKLIAPDGTEVTQTDRPYSFAYDPVAKQWAVTTLKADHAEGTVLDEHGQPIAGPTATFAGAVGYSPATGLVRIARQDGRWALVTRIRTVDLGASITDALIRGIEPNGDVQLTVDDRDEVAHLTDGSLTATAREDVGLANADGSLWAGLQPPKGVEAIDSEDARASISVGAAGSSTPLVYFVAPKNGFFGPWAWEGDDIVTLVFERSTPSSATGTWTLVRLGTDGYTVGRSASWPGRIDAPPYVLETHATTARTAAP